MLKISPQTAGISRPLAIAIPGITFSANDPRDVSIRCLLSLPKFVAIMNECKQNDSACYKLCVSCYIVRRFRRLRELKTLTSLMPSKLKCG